MIRTYLLGFVAVALIACGGGKGGTVDGGGSGDGDGGGSNTDGGAGLDGLLIDAPPFGGACTPGGPQCSDCVDNDGDNTIDGFDIHCTGPLDNDESSFETGIPGDNMDAVNQDCFFDGNSGAGDDKCNIHVCCLLGAATVAECPIGANQYKPQDCPPPIGTKPLAQTCIDNCSVVTPPGCDCFGCCTICDPTTNMCYDILANPSASPDCNETNLADPTKCTRCDQTEVCGPTECGGATCVLCPGQDPSTLPTECNGTTTCPNGAQSCAMGETCPVNSYCDSGCCVGTIF
ncbi:MAG: hypothetical protein H0T79_10185 [Deltaproteobacteria bacterium]|nr:hypothetical protein [Deltaproteobacteria bacterium]